MALLLAGSSFTPSLLPRSPILQGLLAGIVGAFGYGVGQTIAWAVGRVTRWRPSPSTSRRAWRVLGIVGAAFTIVVLVAGWRWQVDLHELMGVDAPAGYDSVLIAVVALLVFVGLVALGRVLRRLTGWVLRRTVGRLPLWLARTIAVTAVVLLVVGVLSGVIFRGFIAVSNATFSVKDTTTDAGTAQPTAPERSGSPPSLIAWDTLGRQGRNFVARGPTEAEIAEFTGGPAMVPVRVYAGLQSAPTEQARADLLVKDLRRAGGFDRKALVVVTTTGTGWVDPAAVDSLEYMLGGDTAVAAAQYSYLPSWISFLVDKSKAQATGVAVFESVYQAWKQLPADHRPKLYISGESLGAFGGQEAFASLEDMAARTGVALCSWAPPTSPSCRARWWPTATRAHPSGCRCTRTVRSHGGLPCRRTWRNRPRRGARHASPTCSTRPTRSCGGHPTCSCISRTGSASPAEPTCCRRRNGSRGSRSGRSPPTWSTPPAYRTVMGTSTSGSTSTRGQR